MIFEVVFCCVAANHLGLIEAIERVVRRDLPIVNCSKCFAFWASLAVGLPSHDFITAVAVSFACAYLATWAELAMGIIDNLYLRIYETFCRQKHEAGAVDADEADNGGDTDRAVSEVRGKTD